MPTPPCGIFPAWLFGEEPPFARVSISVTPVVGRVEPRKLGPPILRLSSVCCGFFTTDLLSPIPCKLGEMAWLC